MAKNEFLDRLASGGLTRREMSKALASVGLAMVTMPLIPGRSHAATKPLIFEWSGYEVPELHQDYINKRGDSPEFSFFGEEEEALQKMRSGFKPDTVHPCVENVLRYRLAGVVKPLDKSRLEHWDDVWGSFKTLDAIWDGDDLYMIPFDWGNSSILYRTDLVDIEEESWELLWDERYKGRMASYDSISNVIVSGLLTGARDPFAMTPAELDTATEKVKKQRDLMAFYWTGISNVEQAMAAGELVAAYAWNEGLVHLKAQGIPVKFMTPKEGILTWVCGIMRGANGPGDEDLVYDWINAMTSPEAGRFLIDDYGYGHSNTKAFDLVSKGRLADLGISSPAEMLATSIFFKTMKPELENEYNRRFEEVKAGL
jgi:spermidine/putrescine transport system substrate-binding protein